MKSFRHVGFSATQGWTLSLFFSYFSPRKPVCNEKITAVDYAADRFIDAVDRRFSYSPLLNCDWQNIIEIRGTSGKVL
jgi:hypothetical protein